MNQQVTKRQYILRHGEISGGSWFWWRVGHIVSANRDDPPLSENGMAKSEKLGKKILEDGFIPDVIVVSPFIRCIETASQIQQSFATQPRIIIEPLLGEYQWLPMKQACASYPNGLPEKYLSSDGSEKIFTYPETLENFHERCNFIEKEVFNKYGNAIFVTHMSPVCYFANYYAKLPLDTPTTIHFSDYLIVTTKINEESSEVETDVKVINW